MPLDGIGLRALTSEINISVIDCKVERVYQPEKYEVILNLRRPKLNTKLLINCHPILSRICISESNKKNPVNPPPFCMLLRKYLEGGKITGINQRGLDRIAILTFKSWKDETLNLYVEIMGKNSNIILTDKNSKIIDAMRHVYPDMSRVRSVLPGLTYSYPPAQNKINLAEADENEIREVFNISSDKPLQRFLVEHFEGFSPFLSYSLALSCGCDPLNRHYDKDTVIYNLLEMKDSILKNKYSPTIYVDNDTYKDFLPFCFNVYKPVGYDSMSEMTEKFYEQRELSRIANDRLSMLTKVINGNLNRCYRKLENLQSELDSGKERDRYKEHADLLMANLYSIKKGMQSIELKNIFRENGEITKIKLDPSKTAIENAQRYYKKYNKLKNSIKYITGQIKDTKDEIEYLESELNNLQNIEDTSEIDEIKNELEATGYIKHKKNKKKIIPKSKPRHFKSSGGYDIFVGKNNIQNDKLTLHYAQAADIWLHTKDIPGSHVIIKANNSELPGSTLLEAAKLAAYFSKARKSSNVPVDYTYKKYVRKPSGAKPGKVIYANQKTLYVTPTAEDINKLRDRQL